MLQSALAIVGQNHQIDFFQSRLVIRELGHQCVVAGFGFKIYAQQLLLASDDAQLDRGGKGRIAMQLPADAIGG